MKALLPALFALLLAPLVSAKEGWLTDIEKAKAQAKAEKKDLLIAFTGSDWCGWCMKLDSEVFNQGQFKDYAAKKYVLVEIDFPRKKKQDATVKAQNEALSAKYRVQGYPTVVVASASGREKGELGYVKGGPSAFIKELESAK